MVNHGQVSAVLVTRGDVDTFPIQRSLLFEDVVVWNNAKADDDLIVYGRYAAIEDARHKVIYVQDDDCLLPEESIRALLRAYEPGKIVCNMPEPFRAHYSDSALVGFGAVFDRDLPAQAFKRFRESEHAGWPWGVAFMEHFYRCCDVVVTTLTPTVWIDVPYENMPYATGPDRMYRQAAHVGERQRMLALARKVRDA